ncbi:MAG TPA: NAD(P)H-dependent oxidoreductase [Methanoregula sp.]|nr:NAD(P)H-dependent oxidoreductase [Methanoregula sp.]
MKISVIVAHPREGSFNHAIADMAADTLRLAGHEVRFHDLYAEHFDPLLPDAEIARNAPLPMGIAEHCREVSEADGIVIVHPNWWGMPPAILKGWVDRILRPGIAYRFAETDTGDGVPDGLLNARAAVVFNTSNTPKAREQEIFGDPLERLWKDCIFSFCGVPIVRRRMFGVIVTSTEEQRKAWLAEVREITRDLFPPV